MAFSALQSSRLSSQQALLAPTSSANSHSQRSLVTPIRAQSVDVSQQVTKTNGAVAPPQRRSSAEPSSRIHLIPQSRWADGIPVVMGSHLMASGTVAPVSRSKGPGIDLEPFIFSYPGAEGAVDVLIHPSEAAATEGVADFVARASAEAIAVRLFLGVMQLFCLRADAASIQRVTSLGLCDPLPLRALSVGVRYEAQWGLDRWCEHVPATHNLCTACHSSCTCPTIRQLANRSSQVLGSMLAGAHH